MRLLRRIFASEEERVTEDILHDLLEDYNAEIRLAQQMRLHAEEAPYPQAADRLRQIAEHEEAQAERLRAEIERLGGSASPPETSPRGGKNHWARLVADLDEERAASKRYLEQAIRWDIFRPEISEFLHSLEREEQHHRLWLQDMIARSDPHALN